MITKELRLESFTAEGLQVPLHARNIRVSKSFFGGEDMALSFELDRDPRSNYRDVAYGNDVILRRGLNPVFKGEMRSITQGEETLTIGCPGQWIYLDDFNAGGQGRLWCDNRYRMWQPTTRNKNSACWPERWQEDNNKRLFFAPRKHERFALNAYWGEYYYYCSHDLVVRLSFDYEFIDPNNWMLALYQNSGTPWGIGVDTLEWSITATASGVKDITLSAPCSYIMFRMVYNTLEAEYAGETGACRGVITNLRVWGQTTESHSSIHVMEAAIDQVAPTTPIDASHDLALEEMPVRDRFTDANGTLLANHRPDKDELRGGWTVAAGGFDIQSNQANCTAVTGLAHIDAGISDGVVCADGQSAAAGVQSIAIVFRYLDVDNYWFWWFCPSTTDIDLYKRVAAANVLVWNSGAIGVEFSYQYNLAVKLRGDRIDCYLGGIWRYGTNDSFNIAQTRHGLRAASVTGIRFDNFEVFQMLPLWPLFYDEGESCYGAVKDAASFGDWKYRALGWGVEAGGDRAFLRVANRQSVRYVIPAQFCRQLSARGETQGTFYTSGWARYIDEEGITRFSAKYYVHVTNDGLVINTTATGNDLASVVYGVARDHTFDFGRVDANLAVEYLIQSLKEQGHPKVQSSIEVFGPVKDLHRGGALIEPIEMEMGYLVQIPWFRATEAEGAAATDIRDFDTTFLMVGMELDVEKGVAKLIPEGAQEDLQRMIKAARAVVEQDEKRLTSKRSQVLGG